MTTPTPAPAFAPDQLPKLGKLAVKHDKRTLRLTKYLTNALPPAPAATDRLSQRSFTWPMFGNDRLGDCTCAALAHMIQFWTGLVGQELTFTDDQVIGLYGNFGYNPANPASDQGANELDVLNFWKTTGFEGHKIGAFAAVDLHTPEAMIEQAIYLFDGLYIGVQLPVTAQGTNVWDYVPDAGQAGFPGSWGGHAVNVVDYNATGPVVITWGKALQMTWAFWTAYVDEAYAPISIDALNGQGKDYEGFDYQTLQADLPLAA